MCIFLEEGLNQPIWTAGLTFECGATFCWGVIEQGFLT